MYHSFNKSIKYVSCKNRFQRGPQVGLDSTLLTFLSKSSSWDKLRQNFFNSASMYSIYCYIVSLRDAFLEHEHLVNLKSLQILQYLRHHLFNLWSRWNISPRELCSQRFKKTCRVYKNRFKLNGYNHALKIQTTVIQSFQSPQIHS